MDRVSIYEYDRKNRERVVKAIEEAGGQILSWSFFAKDPGLSQILCKVQTAIKQEQF